MRTRLWVLPATTGTAVAFAALLWAHPDGLPIQAVDNVSQLAAALFGAAAAMMRARRSAGRLRTSWALTAAGAASWALGQAIWCYYELIAGISSPFPSLSDAGYLLFPVAAAVGMVVRPSRALTGRARARTGLDVLLVVISLFAVSWATVLGEVFHVHADSMLARAVSLAYPAADLAVLTVVVLVLSHADSGERARLAWLGASLASLAVADSGFAYLTATGRYHTGDLVDAGWVAGFLMLAFAAISDAPGNANNARGNLTPPSALLLPYVPSIAGIVAALCRLSLAPGDSVMVVTAAVMVCALVVRQAVVLLDNRSLMARISHQALHDVLTGLANRALFADRLDHALELHRRDMRPVAVILVDLDDFKAVNDTLGHPIGDDLLMRVGERLRAAVRRGDTVARLGGDEFAVLVEDDGDPLEIAERILGSLDNTIGIGEHSIPVGLSMGIARVAPEDSATTASEILRQADLAMYAAKRDGKGHVRVYADTLALGEAADLDRRSAFALDAGAGRIAMAFQPIFRADGTLHGYEALARWSYLGEAVSPGIFLPIASGLGYTTLVDETVLRHAVRDAAGWPDALVLSVNLDGKTLADPAFAGRLSAILADAPFEPRRLVVEVLESNLIEHDEPAMATLARLRSLGIGIAVDDFGAGYASLARLQVLQPDIVKIDRSLVQGQGDRPDGTALLRGITELARQLGATVIAEGVETQGHLSTAIAAGCDAMQGYLLGRPVLAEPVVSERLSATVDRASAM
ncbi:MAG TPA: bifunctional diguanylate cyclase/phosphodiesterase [Jatrophihabitantaceae bacterium]|jgi:diguanylate cyclase (GGDEF)-like protein